MTKNPPCIEKYFSNVPPEEVFTRGIKCFYTNETYGFEFWNTLDEKWKAYYKDALLKEAVIEKRGLKTLTRYHSVLRENWDREFPNFFEETDVAMKRLGLIKEPEPEENEDVRQEEEPPLLNFEDKEEPDELSDFEFFETVSPSGCKLSRNEASINFNNGHKITFNSILSDDIVKSEMIFAKLARNKAGDICIILNRTDGVRLSRSSMTGRRSQSVTINSKDICSQLRELLPIKLNYDIIKIERLPSSLQYIILKIIKK